MTRFLMNFLPEEKRPQEVIAFTQGRLKAAYGVLDAHLAGRDWIVGDGPTQCGFLLLRLTSFTPNPSALRGLTGPISTAGSPGSRRCPAGNTPMT
jgi:hypothetical protein